MANDVSNVWIKHCKTNSKDNGTCLQHFWVILSSSTEFIVLILIKGIAMATSDQRGLKLEYLSNIEAP